MRSALPQKLLAGIFTILALAIGDQLKAQVTVTINASTGTLQSGSVNSGGTKNDGDLVNITTSSNRGWAVFDLSTIPAGAVITSANVIFTTFSSVNSTATNNIRGLIGDPASIAGASLYTQLNGGTQLNASSWTVNTTNTKGVTAAGLTFIENNIGNNILVGFVRGSTNQYNIYGRNATSAQVPKLEVSFLSPCTGTPNPGTINGPTAVCPGKNFTLALANHTISSGIVYQWQSAPAGTGTYTNVGTNADTYTGSITTPTDFRCIATCNASGQSATTAVVSLAVNNYYTCYCKDNLGGGSTAGINSVNIKNTTLNNTSGPSSSPYYTQYPPSGNTTANLQAGGVYEVEIQYSSDAIGSVWLDVNQNGNFESSEWMQINTSGSSASKFIQVPPNTQLGLTGLRIRSADPGTANGSGNMCSNFGSGETEDYVVNIIAAPSNDVRVITLTNPSDDSKICPIPATPIRVVIYNNGSTAQSNIPIEVKLGGATTNTFNYTYTGTLAPFTFDTVLVNTFSMPFAGMYNIDAYSLLSNDVDVTNDTTKIDFEVLFGAPFPRIHNDSVCYGEDGLMYVDADTLTHQWYTNPTDLKPVFVGDSFKVNNAQVTTTLYVSAQNITFNADELQTTTAAGNGCSGGVMFNIVPKTDLNVDSFAALFSSSGSQSVNIYYRMGTFSGFENNSGAWTQFFSGSVNVSSTSSLTVIPLTSSFSMTANTVYGIYIEYPASYTNGSTTFSNSDMDIETGTGLCSPFDGLNTGRMFNGKVFYSMGSVGCESQRLPIFIAAGPQPVVNLGPDRTVCEDIPIILDAGNPGGVYTWGNSNNKLQTYDVTGRAGTYWVTVDKYCEASDTVTIGIDPLPDITGGISYTRSSNNTYQYSVSGLQFANNVLWIFGDGSTSTSMQPIHTYTTAGPYNVTLVAYNACGTDSSFVTIPVGVGQQNISENAVRVYPNPTNTSVNIDVDGGAKIQGVTIVSAVGRTVYQDQNIDAGDKMTIDVSNIPAGNYLIRINSTEGLVNKPIVIIR